VQVGDLIQCVDLQNMEYDGAVSTGLVCKIEHVVRKDGFGDTSLEVRCWAVWSDGQYAWVGEEDGPEVISEGG